MNSKIAEEKVLKDYEKLIYKLANKFKLPYLYDSTPDWSERGQMRDILIPQIKEFDKEIITGVDPNIPTFEGPGWMAQVVLDI